VNVKPLVSIHIITYNQLDFIHETLSSALEQDYENLEVVVADDGSTDGTAEIILEYAERYQGRLIPLVGGPNLGITGNSNRGLKACKGKYIAFQGGDDVLLPGKITAQVAWMEEDEQRVLCGHQVEVFYEDGSRSHALTPQLPSGKGCKWLVEHGCPYGATAVMVRASRLPDGGFDERLPTVSDHKLWIDCLAMDGEFGFIHGLYARYRRHSNNVTGDIDKCLPDLQTMFDSLEDKQPFFAKSIKKGRRNMVDMYRAKKLFSDGFYVKATMLMARTYVLSPSRLWRTIIFRLRKVQGGGL